MAETVYRFMDARTIMNLVAGNWASFETDLEADEPVDGEGLLVVEIPRVRFDADRNVARAASGCRGGIVALNIEPLIEGEDYVRVGDRVFVMADVLVAEPVSIELVP